MIIQSRSDLNLTRFEITVAMVDKSNILRAGMQDARSRNDKLTAKWNRNADVDVHARLERDSRIVENEAHGYGARRDVDLRQDLINASFERTSWIGINRYCGGHSGLEGADASLKNVGVYPDCGKICDGVKLRFRLHVLIGKCVEFGDVAGRRGINASHHAALCRFAPVWRSRSAARQIGANGRQQPEEANRSRAMQSHARRPRKPAGFAWPVDTLARY